MPSPRSEAPGSLAAARGAGAPASPGAGQDRVFEFVRERILDGRYPVGRPLRAQELADETGLSRTPVREALCRLVQEGLAVRTGGWGFAVRTLEIDDVIDLLRVREALEVESARAAVERVDAAVIAELEALLERSRAALQRGEVTESLLTARRFHLAIVAASGNRLLLQMLGSINDRIHLVGMSVVRTVPGRAAQVFEENRAILDALAARDGGRLEAAVRLHIRRAGELFVQRVRAS